MILLETTNRILAETVSAQIKPAEEIGGDEAESKTPSRQGMDIRLCDFDDVSYRVSIDPAALNTMKVSLCLPCYSAIADYGAAAAAQTVYGSLLTSAEPSYDVSLQIPLDPLPLPPDELVNKIANIKQNVLGGVFAHYFDPLLSGKPLTAAFHFALRADTELYFVPRADRVTLVFSLNFIDKADTAIAKIFLQEFVDARRRLGAAPPCTFSANPPLELKEFGVTEPVGNLGFVTFAVMKSHLEGGRKDKVIQVLSVFRNYLQYHIKCSKSYFHSRMRARVVSLLKMLARAKVEKNIGDKEMKTASGKTFTRG